MPDLQAHLRIFRFVFSFRENFLARTNPNEAGDAPPSQNAENKCQRTLPTGVYATHLSSSFCGESEILFRTPAFAQFVKSCLKRTLCQHISSRDLYRGLRRCIVIWFRQTDACDHDKRKHGQEIQASFHPQPPTISFNSNTR